MDTSPVRVCVTMQMWGRVLPIKHMYDQPTICQTKFFSPHRKSVSENICAPSVFPQHRSRYNMFLSFLVSAVKLQPFLLSSPPIQISPVLFWKGGYILCYCMISQNLSSQPLKRGSADWSWVIPAVSPSLGKTWVSPTTRTLPSLSNPSEFFLFLYASETISCQLNRF